MSRDGLLCEADVGKRSRRKISNRRVWQHAAAGDL